MIQKFRNDSSLGSNLPYFFLVLLAFDFSQLIQYVVLLWFFLNLSFFGTMVNFEVELVKLRIW
jgi:hypothetical protein